MPQTTAAVMPLAPFAPTRVHAGPILVAVGGSDPVGVLRAAEVLSGQSPAGVLAVSVAEPLPSYLGGGELAYLPPAYEEERKAGLLEQLTTRIADTVDQQAGWEARVAFGDAAHAIATLAYEVSAPMIVMGLGRHRRIDRFLGLENTLRTVHRARCPVLAVSGQFEHPRHAVIAVDFTPTSARAAEAALPLLDSAATITLVHVWQPIAHNEIALYGDRNVADKAYTSAAEKSFEHLENLLAIGAGMTVEHVMLEGEPGPAILEYATAHGADLIVAGRRGLGSLSRMLSHSVTAELLRGAHCSVLITPEPSYADIDRLRLRLTGTSAAEHPAEWSVQLDNFTKRNYGRTTALEVDDANLGAQIQTTGYGLLGATYDPHDRRVELMLGSPGEPSVHLTRGITDVSSVTVICDAHGLDMGLRLAHGEGQTLLTFVEG